MARGRARSDPGSPSGGTLASIARFWQRTNAPEYVGFLVLLVLYILMVIFVEPFHRMFFINDLNISYPHAEIERVSVPMNFVYALFIPLGIMLLYNFVARSSGGKHEATYLSFAIALILTSFLTDTIKNAVGRPRPDLLARCKPADGTQPDVLVTYQVCTETEHHRLHDGWRSFPSGHSSFSFAGLGFLSLFLAGQLRIFRHHDGGRDLSRALICLVPLIGAALIAISRCEDYRHDVWDVCFGGALGFLVSYWSYRRHWPSLASPDCHDPHPRAELETRNGGWNRIRDEEGGPGAGRATSSRDVGLEMSDLR